MQKTASILLVPFALGAETRCYAELKMLFLDAAKRARVNKLKTAHIWTPIDSHVSLGMGIKV
jgi:hypothetical protein